MDDFLAAFEIHFYRPETDSGLISYCLIGQACGAQIVDTLLFLIGHGDTSSRRSHRKKGDRQQAKRKNLHEQMPAVCTDNTPYEKVGNAEPVSLADEVPFDIPDTWEWAHVGDIFAHNTGKALNASNRSGQLLSYITTSNLYWNRFELASLREMYFTEAEIDKCTATKGDLLVCEGGDFGRAAIWPYDTDIRIQNHIHKLRAFSPVCTEYFYYLFYLYKHAGWIGGKGIGIQGLSANALHAIVLPIPPLAEQERIADCIHKIKPFIDHYEEVEQELDALNTEFPDQLRKSILQLAVQGKLVPLNLLDEPASILLERIRAEKELLIAAGKIKRDKHESIIYRRDNSHYEKLDGVERCIDDELPFEIPEMWCWARFSDVITIATNLVNPDQYPDHLHIAPDNIEKGTGQLLPCKTVSEDCIKSNNHLFRKGQLLYSKIRPALRKATIAPQDGLCSADMYPLQTSLCSRYILLYLLCESFTQAVLKEDTRVKMPKVNQETLLKVLVPIPPLREQERIAASAFKSLQVLKTI